MKLHMVLDYDGYLPRFATLTQESEISDLQTARALNPLRNSIVVCDRRNTITPGPLHEH